MNWLTLVVCAFLLLSGYIGYKKGFVIAVFSLVAFLLTTIITINLYPIGSKLLIENTGIDESIQGKIAEIFQTEEVAQGATTKGKQTEAIQEMPLPEKIKLSIIENNNQEIYKAFGIDKFEEYLNDYITTIVINAIAYIIVFIIVGVILSIVVYILDIISKLPVFDGINKIAGFLLGLLEGLIVVWVLCVFITIFSGSQWAKQTFILINEDLFLSFIYNNNYLLEFVSNVSKVLF